MVLVESAPEVEVEQRNFLQIPNDLLLLVLHSEFAHQVQEFDFGLLAELIVNFLLEQAILIVIALIQTLEFYLQQIFQGQFLFPLLVQKDGVLEL